MHKLLIIGGGAAGIELATYLGNTRSLTAGGLHRKLNVKLVDGRPTHLWKPLLHEVALGTLRAGEDSVNYFQHSVRNKYTFRLGWMDGLDKENKIAKIGPLVLGNTKICGPRQIPYDTLILALGNVPDTYGIPGVEEHCHFLNSLEDAEELRTKILTSLLKIHLKIGPHSKLRVGIVGAGATGIELAAEIHSVMRSLQTHAFKPEYLEVTVYEGGPRILSAADEQLSNFATTVLDKMGIELRLNTQLAKVDENGFIFKDGTRDDKEIKIWAAGVKAPNWMKDLGLQTNHANRIKVNEYQQSIDDSSIYAVGDCACTPVNIAEGHKKVLPPTAQVAHQQAVFLRQHIKAKMQGSSRLRPFKYNHQGFLVSLGDNSAVASLVFGSKDSLNLKGEVARAIYTTIYRKHQAVLYGWPKMMVLWFADKLRQTVLPIIKFH